MASSAVNTRNWGTSSWWRDKTDEYDEARLATQGETYGFESTRRVGACTVARRELAFAGVA